MSSTSNQQHPDTLVTQPAWRKRWNPYLVGAGIGVLSWITFFTMHSALGTSTTMPKIAALATSTVAPQYVSENAYYARDINPEKGKFMFDWQFFLVVGLIGGALVGSRLIGRERFTETIPPLWRERFGPSVAKRFIAAFVGGVILIIGARMAGGCTSGHGISGGLQLAVSSWTFFVAMFVSGVATAFLLFGKAGRHVEL